jgi:hypothetical protein
MVNGTQIAQIAQISSSAIPYRVVFGLDGDAADGAVPTLPLRIGESFDDPFVAGAAGPAEAAVRRPAWLAPVT